ncbi:hypothetical protein QM996_01120 [Sinorhizobium chiapasense]
MSIEKRLDRMIERSEDAEELSEALQDFIADMPESDVEDLFLELARRLMGDEKGDEIE